MKIDPKARAELIKRIAANLSAEDATPYALFEEMQEFQKTLSKKDLAPYETQYLGDDPLANFVWQRLMQLANDVDQIPADSAAQLVDEFCGLPLRYRVTLFLPLTFPEFLAAPGRVTLGGGLSYVRYPPVPASPTTTNIFEMARLTGAANPRGAFEIEVKGWVGTYLETQPVVDAQSLVKSTLELLLALHLVPSTLGWMSILVPHLPTAGIVHQVNDTGLIPVRDIDSVDQSLAKGLQSWSSFLTPKLINLSDGGRALLARALAGNADAARVRLAAKWLFESRHSNSLLAFVETMVSLEILLGENSDEETIGGAIRSRCVYLIGDSMADRSSITTTLVQAYKIRGKIVHTGKDRLSSADSDVLTSLREICSRVIRAEVNRLPD